MGNPSLRFWVMDRRNFKVRTHGFATTKGWFATAPLDILFLYVWDFRVVYTQGVFTWIVVG